VDIKGVASAPAAPRELCESTSYLTLRSRRAVDDTLPITTVKGALREWLILWGLGRKDRYVHIVECYCSFVGLLKETSINPHLFVSQLHFVRQRIMNTTAKLQHLEARRELHSEAKGHNTGARGVHPPPVGSGH
jgi:hypothetical protein